MHISTLIKKNARILEKQANQLLNPFQITHGYTYFLLELFKKNGMTQTQLQKSIGIEHSTVVRTLDRMERDGLIERRLSSSDRRAFHIFLTEKGMASKLNVMAAASKLNQSLLHGFSKHEQEMLQSYLERLIKNLEYDKD